MGGWASPLVPDQGLVSSVLMVVLMVERCTAATVPNFDNEREERKSDMRERKTERERKREKEREKREKRERKENEREGEKGR